jgi:hypothetical protein
VAGGHLPFYRAVLFVTSHNVNCYKRKAWSHPRSKTSRRFTIGPDSSLDWIRIDQRSKAQFLKSNASVTILRIRGTRFYC